MTSAMEEKWPSILENIITLNEKTQQMILLFMETMEKEEIKRREIEEAKKREMEEAKRRKIKEAKKKREIELMKYFENMTCEKSRTSSEIEDSISQSSKKI